MITSGAYFATHLRRELCLRNRRFAQVCKLGHVESYGGMRVVVYQPSEDGARHGNFIDASYAAIVSHPEWRLRLNKVHTSAKQVLPRSEHKWRELDSCVSSDALLMNVFCYPGVAGSSAVTSLLGIDRAATPQFGFKARVPLSNGLADRTEVDMRFGDLLVEAKLTESDFQTKDAAAVMRYRELAEVFEVRMLPRVTGKPAQRSAARSARRFLCYQLIRNVLAAHANHCSFCVLLDARRPDLSESWYAVMRAVRLGDLRVRCKVLTWQELSETLPRALQVFLNQKYGIMKPNRAANMPSLPGDWADF